MLAGIGWYGQYGGFVALIVENGFDVELHPESFAEVFEIILLLFGRIGQSRHTKRDVTGDFVFSNRFCQTSKVG